MAPRSGISKPEGASLLPLSSGLIRVFMWVRKMERYIASNPMAPSAGTFSTSGPVLSSPVLGNDGVLYAASDDRILYAINSSDGTEKWSFNLANAAGPSSPAIGFGGVLYMGCGDGSLYAVETKAERIAVSPWPLFKHDVRHTGRNNSNQGPTADAGSDQTVKQDEHRYLEWFSICGS